MERGLPVHLWLIKWESHQCVRGLLTLRLRKLSEWGKMGSLQGHSLVLDQYFFILYVSIIGPSTAVLSHSSLRTRRIGRVLVLTLPHLLIPLFCTHMLQNTRTTNQTSNDGAYIALYEGLSEQKWLYSIRLCAQCPWFPLIIEPAVASKVSRCQYITYPEKHIKSDYRFSFGVWFKYNFLAIVS